MFVGLAIAATILFLGVILLEIYDRVGRKKRVEGVLKSWRAYRNTISHSNPYGTFPELLDLQQAVLKLNMRDMRSLLKKEEGRDIRDFIAKKHREIHKKEEEER